MKRRFIFLIAPFTFLSFANGYSQTGYRSIVSGNWGDFNTWERSTNIYNPIPTWVPAVGTPSAQVPTSNNFVFVRNGHTVTLESSGKNSRSISIETGGKLFANGAVNSVRVGVPSSGNAGSIDTLTVDGILGGPGELMPLEFGVGAASVWIRGTGTIEIGRIRPLNGNLNYAGSAATNAAPGLRILIDKDMRLNVGNYAISATNSAPSANDSISITIFPGRTVTVANPVGTFHNDLTATIFTAGKYVYNINGTLDLTANTNPGGGTRLMPFANAGSSITLNVNGLLKLGGYFKADTITGNAGTVSLNINNGGVVDASLTSNLTAGSNGSNVFFKISGNGSLKRTVSELGVRVKFPIGTTSATPVYFNPEAGPAEVFTVTLKDAFTNPAPSNTLAKEWNISEATPGGNTDTLRFQWTTADQSGGFTGANSVFIGRWDGSAWAYTPALVSGTGTNADPYIARGTGFSSFGLFILTNSGTTPVAFVNVKAFQKQNGVQVEFGNATESDVVNYVIEKSADGRNFTALNTLQPKSNTGGLSSYTYFDAFPNSGNNFYRIKVTERNGSILYSNTLSINLRSRGTWVNAYPNPVKNNMVNVQLEGFERSIYTIAIFNQGGQKVYAKNINHLGGTATFTVELPASIQKGVYSLQVGNTVSTVINKIVVE